MDAARILVVQEDPTVGLSLELLLRIEGFHSEAQPDGMAALRSVRHCRPDLALVDMSLPDGPDGLMVARHLRRADVPFILIGLRGHEGDITRAFEAGADDYIARPFFVKELLARVGVALRRTGARADRVLELDDLRLYEAGHRVVRGDEDLNPTPLQFRLLTTLLHQQGRVLSKKQLLAEVWDYASGDPNIVEAHVSALRRKIEARGPRLIHTIRGTGYVARL